MPITWGRRPPDLKKQYAASIDRMTGVLRENRYTDIRLISVNVKDGEVYATYRCTHAGRHLQLRTLALRDDGVYMQSPDNDSGPFVKIAPFLNTP